MITAWPFLLGVEPGTVPFGRAFRNNLSSRDGTFKNFRPCIEETKAVKMIKTTKSSIRFLRAINVVVTKSRERERRFSGFCWWGGGAVKCVLREWTLCVFIYIRRSHKCYGEE